MRYLKTYEKYNNAPLYQANTLLQVLEKNIKKWFTSGSLSKQGLTLEDSDKSFTNDVANKTLICRFTDAAFLYQVIVVVGIKDLFDEEQTQSQSSDDMEESVQNEGVQDDNRKIENIDVKIKKYDLNGQRNDNIDGPLIDFWEGQVGVKEFTEDFIIEKISQMEDEDLATTNTALNSEETQGGIQDLF